MPNITGGRRRRVIDVVFASRYWSSAWLDCDHTVIRERLLKRGMVVYCGKCPPLDAAPA